MGDVLHYEKPTGRHRRWAWRIVLGLLIVVAMVATPFGYKRAMDWFEQRKRNRIDRLARAVERHTTVYYAGYLAPREPCPAVEELFAMQPELSRYIPELAEHPDPAVATQLVSMLSDLEFAGYQANEHLCEHPNHGVDAAVASGRALLTTEDLEQCLTLAEANGKYANLALIQAIRFSPPTMEFEGRFVNMVKGSTSPLTGTAVSGASGLRNVLCRGLGTHWSAASPGAMDVLTATLADTSGTNVEARSSIARHLQQIGPELSTKHSDLESLKRELELMADATPLGEQAAIALLIMASDEERPGRRKWWLERARQQTSNGQLFWLKVLDPTHPEGVALDEPFTANELGPVIRSIQGEWPMHEARELLRSAVQNVPDKHRLADGIEALGNRSINFRTQSFYRDLAEELRSKGPEDE